MSVLALTLSLPTVAVDWSLDLAAGYAWDDNVGLDELERATGESDEVTTLEAQGSAEFK